MTDQTDRDRESHVRSFLSILSKYELHFTQHEIAAEIADWLATHDANKEAEIKRLRSLSRLLSETWLEKTGENERLRKERDDVIDDFHISHGVTWQDECERLRGVISEVWDEGFDAGERDVMNHNHRNDFDSPCIANPYRLPATPEVSP